MEGWYPGFDSSESGARKWGGKEGKSKYKNYEGAIYHFGGRDTRSKSTLACHPVSSPRDFHNRDIFLGPVPLPSPFLLVNDGKLMYGSWLEWLYTHEGNSPPLLPEGEGWRQPRHPVGKTPCSLGSRKTVHAVSPNSARACSLIDFSAGSVPPAGHTSLFPPLHSNPARFRPDPCTGAFFVQWNSRRDFFFLSLLFSSFSLFLFGFVLRFFLSFVKVRIYCYFCWNIFSRNGLVGNVIYCVCV